MRQKDVGDLVETVVCTWSVAFCMLVPSTTQSLLAIVDCTKTFLWHHQDYRRHTPKFANNWDWLNAKRVKVDLFLGASWTLTTHQPHNKSPWNCQTPSSRAGFNLESECPTIAPISWSSQTDLRKPTRKPGFSVEIYANWPTDLAVHNTHENSRDLVEVGSVKASAFTWTHALSAHDEIFVIANSPTHQHANIHCWLTVASPLRPQVFFKHLGLPPKLTTFFGLSINDETIVVKVYTHQSHWRLSQTCLADLAQNSSSWDASGKPLTMRDWGFFRVCRLLAPNINFKPGKPWQARLQICPRRLSSDSSVLRQQPHQEKGGILANMPHDGFICTTNTPNTLLRLLVMRFVMNVLTMPVENT